LWYFFLQVVKYHAASFQKTCTALAYRPALGARARFAFSNAHAAVLVFGGGSPAGLLSWRGAGAAADAWLAHARRLHWRAARAVCAAAGAARTGLFVFNVLRGCRRPSRALRWRHLADGRPGGKLVRLKKHLGNMWGD